MREKLPERRNGRSRRCGLAACAGRWGGPQEGYKTSSGPGLWQELQARVKKPQELESDLARRAPLQGKGRRIASRSPPGRVVWLVGGWVVFLFLLSFLFFMSLLGWLLSWVVFWMSGCWVVWSLGCCQPTKQPSNPTTQNPSNPTTQKPKIPTT